LLIFRYLQE